MSSIWMGCALVCHSPMQVTVTWLCSRLDMVRVPYLWGLQIFLRCVCVPMHMPGSPFSQATEAQAAVPYFPGNSQP